MSRGRLLRRPPLGGSTAFRRLIDCQCADGTASRGRDVFTAILSYGCGFAELFRAVSTRGGISWVFVVRGIWEICNLSVKCFVEYVGV